MQEKAIKQSQDSPQNTIPDEREKKQTLNQGNDLGLSSILGILTPTPSNSNEEHPIKRTKKKKIPKRGIKR